MPSLSYQNLLSLLTTIRDENAIHANTALRVGTAMIEMLRYMNDGPFLHKDQADTTNYLLTLLAGALIGDSGQIRLNPDGSISCQRLTVEGSAVFQELVFNHQNVLEGDTYFTDRGTIEEVTYLGANQYRLLMRKEHENDITTFHPYDVLRSAMNNLDQDGTYRTAWMRVNSVDTTANTVDVTLFNAEDVPGGVNYEPEAGTNVVRWGNQQDESRQQVFFLSSEDGRLVFYANVTSPIVGDENYELAVGRLPDIAPVRRSGLVGEPGIYAKNLLYQHATTVHWVGDVRYVTVDLGDWTQADAESQAYYYRRETQEGTTTYTRCQVSYKGQTWHTTAVLDADSTQYITDAPALEHINWVHVAGATSTLHLYTTSETKDLDEGGVDQGSDVPLWREDQDFFLTKEIDGEYNPYYYCALRPYMWRQTVTRLEGETEGAVSEAPHIIGVFGETGFQYIIRGPFDTIVLPMGKESQKVMGAFTFWTDGGGVRNPFNCYCMVRVRQADGAYRYPIERIFVGTGTGLLSIEVTQADAALEVLINSSGEQIDTTYLARKEIAIVKPVAGPQGPQGEAGLPGPQGFAGPIVRVFDNELLAGEEYHADEEPNTEGVRFQDFLAIEGDYGTSGYLAFQCKKTYTQTTGIVLSGLTAEEIRRELGTEHWTEVSINALSGFFMHLIARNANIRMLAGSQFVIASNAGKVLAGMGNRVDGKGEPYYLWSGGKDADEATFKVFSNGVIDAMAGRFSGFITRKNTIVTARNVAQYVKEGINPFTGRAEMMLDMELMGSSMAMYGRVDDAERDPKFDGTGQYVCPTGYGSIVTALNGIATVADWDVVSLVLPFAYAFSAFEGNYSTTSIVKLYGEGDYETGRLNLYRHWRWAQKGDSVAVAAACMAIATDDQQDPDWKVHPFRVYGQMQRMAQEMVGCTLSMRLLCRDATGPDVNVFGVGKNGQTDHDEGVAYQVACNDGTLLMLTCIQHQDSNPEDPRNGAIYWEANMAKVNYYDRYTLGLEDYQP